MNDIRKLPWSQLKHSQTYFATWTFLLRISSRNRCTFPNHLVTFRVHGRIQSTTGLWICFLVQLAKSPSVKLDCILTWDLLLATTICLTTNPRRRYSPLQLASDEVQWMLERCAMLCHLHFYKVAILSSW